jgi:hypothetical protein
MIELEQSGPLCEMKLSLPGPDRLRTPKDYYFRLRYRSPCEHAVGCVMTWDIVGGRMPYQIAVERRMDDRLKLHCTCADSVFRREEEGRLCKHAQGFLEAALSNLLRQEPGPDRRSVA